MYSGPVRQSEGIFVNIGTLQQQLVNEVSGTNVVHEVAELLVTERVITQVLDDGASVGIGMRFFDLIVSETGYRVSNSGRISSVQSRSTTSS